MNDHATINLNLSGEGMKDAAAALLSAAHASQAPGAGMDQALTAALLACRNEAQEGDMPITIDEELSAVANMVATSVCAASQLLCRVNSDSFPTIPLTRRELWMTLATEITKIISLDGAEGITLDPPSDAAPAQEASQ